MRKVFEFDCKPQLFLVDLPADVVIVEGQEGEVVVETNAPLVKKDIKFTRRGNNQLYISGDKRGASSTKFYLHLTVPPDTPFSADNVSKVSTSTF